MGLGSDEFPKLKDGDIRKLVYEIQKYSDELQNILVPKSAPKDDKNASAVDDDFKKPEDTFNDTYLVWEPETLG